MKTATARDFKYSFPAIRGIQAGREYYVTMCPWGLVPKMFHFNDEELPAALRAQRSLNKSRLPAITRYLTKNQDNYVLSSLTASVNGEVAFEPLGANGAGENVGLLSIPMGATFVINDGQHRRAAMEAAMKEKPSLEYETISIVLFVDAGLGRSQQMFADLNRHAVRPTKSLGILYDFRDPMARLADRLSKNVQVFRGMTEMSRSTISNRSRKMFTLSSIYQATKKLLNKKEGDEVLPKEEEFAVEFWNELSSHIPDWGDAVDRKASPCELRRDYVHSHGVALQALAIAGSALVCDHPKTWRKDLAKLRGVDWLRGNAKLWEGRAMIGGRLSKAQNNVVLTANIFKRLLGLSLTPIEKKVESLYEQGRRKH